MQMEKEHYYVGKAKNEHGLYKRAVLIFLIRSNGSVLTLSLIHI